MDAVITWESFDIKNWDQSFLTDTNGLNLVKRRVKSRNPTDILTVNLSDAIYNYYPVTSSLAITDTSTQRHFLVLNDRPQGGTGFRPGRVELMFNRRGASQDELGMSENVNEFAHGEPIRTSHRYWVKVTRDREDLLDTV